VATNEGDAESAWRVHGERVVYDNEWIRVLLTDVELPDGERFEHHVVKLRPAAMTVLLDDEDRVLMLWRHRFVSDRWGWELPGGLVDDGEDPETTAVRELIEETGYRPRKMRHLTRFQPMVGMVDSWHDVYLGEGADLVAKPTELNESARLEWVPLSSALELIDRGDVWNSGTLVALLHTLALRQREGN
jgi:8-oxo-dGTP pyrophosphatase MutT (NUDIX family)